MSFRSSLFLRVDKRAVKAEDVVLVSDTSTKVVHTLLNNPAPDFDDLNNGIGRLSYLASLQALAATTKAGNKQYGRILTQEVDRVFIELIKHELRSPASLRSTEWWQIQCRIIYPVKHLKVSKQAVANITDDVISTLTLSRNSTNVFLYILLDHIQNVIARYGESHDFFIDLAHNFLSMPGIDINHMDEYGNSMLTKILGQNSFQGVFDRWNARIYMPPIMKLLDHPAVIANSTELDRAVRLSTFSRFKARLTWPALAVYGLGTVALVGLFVTAAVASVVIPEGTAVLLVVAGPLILISPPLLSALILGMRGDESRHLSATGFTQLQYSGYRYLSSYHNPFTFTHKNVVRLKHMCQALWSGIKRGFKHLFARGHALDAEVASETSPLLGGSTTKLHREMDIEAGMSHSNTHNELDCTLPFASQTNTLPPPCSKSECQTITYFC